MELMQERYVPKWLVPGENGLVKLWSIPCHGDQLTIERITDSKRARAANKTAEERLEGLEQIPQEFHKRGILLQVHVG